MSFPLKFRSGIDFIFISYHGYGQIRYTHGIKQLLLLNGHMLPRTPAPTQWHQQISRKLLVKRVRSINSLFRVGVSVSLYFPRDHFLLIPTTTWYFRFCHALCIWHWLIRKHFDSRFEDITVCILVENWSSCWLLNFLLLHRAGETQWGRNSCPRLQFLAFSLNSIMSLSR